MSQIRTRPASDEYRTGWERIYGRYNPQSICFKCKAVHDGNLDVCPDCGCDWLEKRYANGEYVPDGNHLFAS